MDIKPIIQKAKKIKIKIKVISVDERNYVNDLAMQLIRFLASKGIVDGYMNILKILKSYVTSRSLKKKNNNYYYGNLPFSQLINHIV
jgi:hypothetical protein